MKNSLLIWTKKIFIAAIASSLLFNCNDDNEENTTDLMLTESDRSALLFMLEEEKLARDTYMFLNDQWAINQFANIQSSEQIHMDAVESLLIQYGVEYTVLPIGEFENENLQNFYDQFVVDGSVSQSNALQIGATIEDLDIVDLQQHIETTTTLDIISVFNRLQCGSRNHLRSFVSAIENSGNIYEPQFLTVQEYEAILSLNHEQCN